MGMVLYYCKKLCFSCLPILVQQYVMNLWNIELWLTVAKAKIISRSSTNQLFILNLLCLFFFFTERWKCKSLKELTENSDVFRAASSNGNTYLLSLKKEKREYFFAQKLLFMRNMGIASRLFIFPMLLHAVYIVSRSTVATSKIHISQQQVSPTTNALPGVAH